MPLDHDTLARRLQRPHPTTTPATRRPAYGALVGVLILAAAVAGCSDQESAANDVPSTAKESSESSEVADADTTESTSDFDPDASASTAAADGDVPTQPGSTLVPATSPAATAVEQPPVGVDTLPPVSLAQPAEVESGLEFTVVAVRDVEVEPQEGTDDLVGPAVAIDIEVVNNGHDTVELTRFVVSAAGTESELSSIPGAFNEPFAGVLEPGETATATFGFRTGGESVTMLRLDDGLSRSTVIVEL